MRRGALRRESRAERTSGRVAKHGTFFRTCEVVGPRRVSGGAAARERRVATSDAAPNERQQPGRYTQARTDTTATRRQAYHGARYCAGGGGAFCVVAT